ncbi:Hcp family type VI secretion system effector [Acerihabitans arboris]|uniref:Type VI secretion system tube protein Hcp n=1 Tax=Acerihabitans arboris TaxID=2691583 RepID=A0A845SLX5_9GAMM|nr:type VI secretion system tube protein Hcp [Acerihabitans arboris]NDL64392.1 hypothetical protein [Acerihabitans arboris]
MNNSIYLKVDSVTGEAKDEQHVGWIDVQHFRWRITQPTENSVGGGGGIGKAVVREMEVLARIDKAMPTMMKKCVEGTHLSAVTLGLRKAAESSEDYLLIKMQEVMLSAVEIAPHGDTGALEGQAVAPGAMAVLYRFSPSVVGVTCGEQLNTGALSAKVEFGWDVKKNAAAEVKFK